eukprot:TRINITY_DN93982_c0_g1_i1.p1 TRINITY_DN93982_c0_g1~~TRINITY_DN93982_c0_g1_i1.p1  ORF type:complete len:607 (+),score=51.28 TRINITY_DN93982_c0_g1_i1:26-1846(+)
MSVLVEQPGCVPGPRKTEAPLATTSYGKLRGLQRRGCVVFRGVPYAEVPERFCRPHPPQPWEGVRECRHFGHAAIQPRLALPHSAQARVKLAKHVARLTLRSSLRRLGLIQDQGASFQSQAGAIRPLPGSGRENALYLNVASPTLEGPLAPVLVWIHGGAFTFGSGSDGVYAEGVELVRREGVVVVTINYRLGCFGFLHVPGGDANCGLWDQIQALRWIQSEIHHFGGDPRMVTIFGESAGGMSCGTLLASPVAQPLFSRAILMSGAMSNVLERDDAENIARQFCTYASVECNAESLRSLSAEQLLAVQVKLHVDFSSGRLKFPSGALVFQPCVDGVLLPARPLDAFKQGVVDLSQKQIMIGSNAQEFNLFSGPSHFQSRRSLPGVASRMAAQFGPSRMFSSWDNSMQEMRDLVKMVRREQRLSTWNEAEKQLLTMIIFEAPARLAAESLSHVADQVFLYNFAFGAGGLGAAHAAEIPLLFGTHHGHWMLEHFSGARNDADAADTLSRHLIGSFCSFARSGSPNSAALGREHGSNASLSPTPLHWPSLVPSESCTRIYVFDRQCRIQTDVGGAALIRVMQLVSQAQRPWGVTVRANLGRGGPKSKL